jgi:small-conductance mechanosensitive channel
MNEIDYSKIISTIEKTVSSSSLYWQSLSLIFCFVFSYFFYKLSRQFVFPKIISSTLKKNIELNRLVTRYALPMLYPIFALIFLSIAFSLYSKFFKETVIFLTTIKLVALFLFLRFLRISSNSTFVANTAGILLMPTLVLDIFGFLEPTIDYLDSFALKVGNVRISIYLALKAFVVLMISIWLSNMLSKKSKSFIEGSKSIKLSTKNIISKFIDITVYTILVIVLLKVFGVDMTTFAVLGGAIGVGIGLGLQKIASNFLSGIILLFEKSVEIGDMVELDNGNIFGTIKHFGGRYLLIECLDGKEVLVPNEEFIVNKVTNWTYSNNRARIEIKFGIERGANLEKAREIMIECAKENPRCLSYPEIECYISDFGEQDVKMVLYFWISDIVEGRQKPKSEVLLNIWKKFAENGIKLSLPQREMKMIN